MLSIVESESNNVEKKIQESWAKRECTNEAYKKEFTSVKNKCDTCKFKVEKTETGHSRFATPLNWHITKSFMIGQVPSHNFTCQQIGEPKPQKYDWVYLVPGLGHLHMNQLKTILKIMDKIMLEPSGKEVLNISYQRHINF